MHKRHIIYVLAVIYQFGTVRVYIKGYLRRVDSSGRPPSTCHEDSEEQGHSRQHVADAGPRPGPPSAASAGHPPGERGYRDRPRGGGGGGQMATGGDLGIFVCLSTWSTLKGQKTSKSAFFRGTLKIT